MKRVGSLLIPVSFVAVLVALALGLRGVIAIWWVFLPIFTFLAGIVVLFVEVWRSSPWSHASRKRWLKDLGHDLEQHLENCQRELGNVSRNGPPEAEALWLGRVSTAEDELKRFRENHPGILDLEPTSPTAA